MIAVSFPRTTHAFSTDQKGIAMEEQNNHQSNDQQVQDSQQPAQPQQTVQPQQQAQQQQFSQQPQQQYAPQGQPQQQQQYYAPQGQMPQQPQYAAQAQGAPAKSATTYIVLSVLEILFLGGLLGIIPLVFSIQANSAYKLGDIAGGDAKAKTAKTALIVVAVIGILIFIAMFAMGGIALFSAMSVQ